MTDVRTNAAELAVAIDQSLSQIAASGVSLVGPTPQASVLPPSDLATATPTPLPQPLSLSSAFRCVRPGAFKSTPTSKKP